MKAVWTIASKELTSFFDSLVAYVLLVLLLLVSGYFTWIGVMDIFFTKELSLAPFFQITSDWILFWITPALTMRMLAEENRTGTIELLLTKSVSDWQVIIGKSLSCLLLLAIALAFTLPYYITLMYLGDVDHGAVLCGYLGLLLSSCVYISIGIFASSITNNQIVAFLFALLIGLFFHWLLFLLTLWKAGTVTEILNYLCIRTHFDSMSRGVVDTKDILYFVLFSFTGLLLAKYVLSRRNLAD